MTTANHALIPVFIGKFNVHHKVKSTGFSRSALAGIMSLWMKEALWNTGTAAIRFFRLSTTLYG